MAGLEEFEESEVIFSDNCNGNVEAEFEIQEFFHVASKHGRLSKSAKKKNNNKIVANNSVPVDIPDSVFRFRDRDELVRDWSSNDDDDDEGEVVPPHVIVGRRISGGKMAYSVCTGNGRTLKGRDLSRVRNSILRLTGFLET